MRILTLIYYYEPYTSGMTNLAVRIADGMSQRGHRVVSVSGRYDTSLASHEVTATGVEIIRVPVAARFDRAIILPTFIPAAIRSMRNADVVQFNIPMVEAAPLALIARLMGKRVVVTHCSDLVLERSPLTRFAAFASRWSGILAGHLAHTAITLTNARAKVSPTASHWKRNLRIVPPPITADMPPQADIDAFIAGRGWQDKTIVGYVGRYTGEKAIHNLLATIPALQHRFPDVRVALVGPIRDPRTGERYRGPWDEYLTRHADVIEQLDELSDHDLACFYAAIDVLVLPSIDFTETFGMVQVEAMMRGTPTVASNLPGVNEPINVTGYGKLAIPGDVADLTRAILLVLEHPDRYAPDRATVDQHFALDTVLDAYERIYRGDVAPA